MDRSELRHHPLAPRLRAIADGRTIADTEDALLVWEPRRVVPFYAVPAADLRAETSPGEAQPDPGSPILHPGHAFAIHTAPGQTLDVAGRPAAGFVADALPDHVVLDFHAFDWLEEDEEVVGHPRDPFHRIDVRRSSRRVQVEVGGAVVADTTRAHLLFETNLPTRYYLPREDTVGLTPSDATTTCAYKGHASYFSLPGHADIAWAYEDPFPEAIRIKGRVAFWNERATIVVDGVRHEPPTTVFTDALRDEFRDRPA